MDRLQIHLPKPMLTRLKEIAEKRDYSVAEIIRSIIEKHLDENEEKEKPCG
jgi:metal-responsive CopG/Arc/MetJ family transcriptional regulator